MRRMKSADAWEEFQMVIGEVQDTNYGISLIALPSITNERGQKILNYDIWVLNNTEEAITFPNNGFGIQVFTYDQASNFWRPVELGIWPSNYPFTLPSEPKDIQGDYRWILNSHSIKGVDWKNPIRVYVSGIGDLSKKKFGAYEDILLEK